VAANQVTERILGDTIDHLRAYCPPFGGRVAGAADFQLGLQRYNANMILPSAFVVPLDQTTEGAGNQQLTGLWQIVDKHIGVVVELANADRRGQGPAMQYDEVEAALFSTLLMWSPVACRVPGRQGYAFAGGRFLDLDRARVFYQWEFSLRYTLTDDDGWHEPEPLVDLVGIELDFYTAPPWDMPPPDNRPPAAIVKLDMHVELVSEDGAILTDEQTGEVLTPDEEGPQQ
jgi:hypothetical protein